LEDSLSQSSNFPIHSGLFTEALQHYTGFNNKPSNRFWQAKISFFSQPPDQEKPRQYSHHVWKELLPPVEKKLLFILYPPERWPLILGGALVLY
jgi:hypothetical protein